MSNESSPPIVTQLRLVVEVDDFDEAVWFFRDVLGLNEEFFVESEGDARVMALGAGRATLEIVNPAQRRLIDHLEVGRDVSRSIRVAFQVTDTNLATDRLVAAGAELIAPPTETPWRSLNSRLEAPVSLCARCQVRHRRRSVTSAPLDKCRSRMGSDMCGSARELLICVQLYSSSD